MRRACLLLGVAAGLLAGCSTEPAPIAFGSDACAHCSMTIVDRTHAAQFVTTKGKQYKYDAIECLVQHLPSFAADQVARLIVADYEAPGAMTDALDATYLISEKIKSPMGANLSAFASRPAAEAELARNSGTLLGWEDLPRKLKAGG